MSRLLVIDASIAIDLLARYRPEPIEQLLWAEHHGNAEPTIIRACLH